MKKKSAVDYNLFSQTKGKNDCPTTVFPQWNANGFTPYYSVYQRWFPSKTAFNQVVLNYTFLNNIDSPKDLRKIPVDQLPEVCRELRDDIVKELSVNPGHLASSLGVTELTVALHYVYDTPYDRIVWDVGHQAYGHKILTGRRDNFCTNRKLHGICPFPNPAESEYDTFTCGHASNSISAALGMAVAAQREQEMAREGDNAKEIPTRHVVAVIGDGAMSGGLAFEGLNNVSSSPNDLLIILNDNNMSIDHSVGGMKQYLLNLTTNESYNHWRDKAAKWMFSKGILNDSRKKAIIRLNNSIKSLISEQQNIFEGLNIRYFGPVYGHDVKELVRVLNQLKNMRGPKLLHIHTVKGKGYEPAEHEATIWHAPGKFDADTGKRIKGNEENLPPKFQDVFGETIVELAKQNPKIMGVTPAMPTGCSLNKLMEAMPERAFDVGIAEGHAVTFSGGMAKDGLIPFCNIYSAFAQRSYDNIIHDVAILDLPVVLCLDRAGLVGEDGATHHGAFDMAALRPVPNLTISAPMNEHELRRLMFTAQLPGKGAFVIRYPRGRGVLVDWRCPLEEVEVGKGRKLSEGDDIAILSIGTVGNNVQKAICNLNVKKSVAHYDMRFLKPLDEDILHEVGKKFRNVITVEDGLRNGGMGSAVMEWFADHDYDVRVKRLGLPDYFVEHGTVAQLQHIVGIDVDGIVQALEKIK